MKTAAIILLALATSNFAAITNEAGAPGPQTQSASVPSAVVDASANSHETYRLKPGEMQALGWGIQNLAVLIRQQTICWNQERDEQVCAQEHVTLHFVLPPGASTTMTHSTDFGGPMRAALASLDAGVKNIGQEQPSLRHDADLCRARFARFWPDPIDEQPITPTSHLAGYEIVAAAIRFAHAACNLQRKLAVHQDEPLGWIYGS